jgi:hypothetical protein
MSHSQLHVSMLHVRIDSFSQGSLSPNADLWVTLFYSHVSIGPTVFLVLVTISFVLKG